VLPKDNAVVSGFQFRPEHPDMTLTFFLVLNHALTPLQSHPSS
jgi:hypothetical protein